MSPPVTTILVGNPGVGKSTILNSLVGQRVFDSGISFGGGLTKTAQTHRAADGGAYIDTPGLSDVQLRQQAAVEIEKALKVGGLVRIVFVITLEAGRVRPDDKTTMKLILQSAPQIGSNYSIIINKIPPHSITKIRTDINDRRSLITALNDGLSGTNNIYFHPLVEDLQDQDNVLIVDADLLDFLKLLLPATISPDQVKPIAYNNYEATINSLTQQLDEMRSDMAKAQERMKQQEVTQKSIEQQKQEQGGNFFGDVFGKLFESVLGQITNKLVDKLLTW